MSRQPHHRWAALLGCIGFLWGLSTLLLTSPGMTWAADVPPVPEPAATAEAPTITPVALTGSALAARVRSSGNLRDAVCLPNADANLREGELLAPVLLYHFVGRQSLESGNRSTSRYNVTTRDFETQLALLHHLGYQTVTVGEIADALRGQGKLPERAIALTFDDGWTEHYTTVFPLLKAYGMRATFYVPSAYAIGGRLVSWEQLREMAAAGMEIGAHTRSHVNLTEVGTEIAWQELLSSRITLEARLGITVTTMAYPYGAYSLSTVELTKRAGYIGAVALGPALKHRLERVYALPRLEVVGRWSLADFVTALPWRGEGMALCRSLERPPTHGLLRE